MTNALPCREVPRQPRLNQTLALFLAGSLLLLTGCATLGYTAPDVTIVDLKVTDVTVFETSATFTVRLGNENRHSLDVNGGVYNIYLNGLPVGKGLSNNQFELPRLGFATEEVEIFINNVAMATRIRSILNSKTLNYRVKGKVWIKNGATTRRLKIDREGAFDFNKAGDPDNNVLDQLDTLGNP